MDATALSPAARACSLADRARSTGSTRPSYGSDRTRTRVSRHLRPGRPAIRPAVAPIWIPDHWREASSTIGGRRRPPAHNEKKIPGGPFPAKKPHTPPQTAPASPAGAAEGLPPGGVLLLYGPFSRGAERLPRLERFDQALRGTPPGPLRDRLDEIRTHLVEVCPVSVDALFSPVYPEKDPPGHLPCRGGGVALGHPVEHLLKRTVVDRCMRSHPDCADPGTVYPLYCRFADDRAHGCPDNPLVRPQIEKRADDHVACGPVERIEEKYVHAPPVLINPPNIRIRGNARDILESR